MSVVKNERNISKVEFDDAYFKIYESAVKITMNNFGCTDDDIKEQYSLYIHTLSREVLQTAIDIGRQIRVANSIYPKFRTEYERRRISQDTALGLCFDLLTKYQLAMKTLDVDDDKYIEDIKNLQHEINCIKKWRTSDYGRFKDLP